VNQYQAHAQTAEQSNVIYQVMEALVLNGFTAE
jgi:hypothetical protein